MLFDRSNRQYTEAQTRSTYLKAQTDYRIRKQGGTSFQQSAHQGYFKIAGDLRESYHINEADFNAAQNGSTIWSQGGVTSLECLTSSQCANGGRCVGGACVGGGSSRSTSNECGDTGVSGGCGGIKDGCSKPGSGCTDDGAGGGSGCCGTGLCCRDGYCTCGPCNNGFVGDCSAFCDEYRNTFGEDAPGCGGDQAFCDGLCYACSALNSKCEKLNKNVARCECTPCTDCNTCDETTGECTADCSGCMRKVEGSKTCDCGIEVSISLEARPAGCTQDNLNDAATLDLEALLEERLEKKCAAECNTSERSECLPTLERRKEALPCGAPPPWAVPVDGIEYSNRQGSSNCGNPLVPAALQKQVFSYDLLDYKRIDRFRCGKCECSSDYDCGPGFLCNQSDNQLGGKCQCVQDKRVGTCFPGTIEVELFWWSHPMLDRTYGYYNPNSDFKVLSAEKPFAYVNSKRNGSVDWPVSAWYVNCPGNTGGVHFFASFNGWSMPTRIMRLRVQQISGDNQYNRFDGSRDENNLPIITNQARVAIISGWLSAIKHGYTKTEPGAWPTSQQCWSPNDFYKHSSAGLFCVPPVTTYGQYPNWQAAYPSQDIFDPTPSQIKQAPALFSYLDGPCDSGGKYTGLRGAPNWTNACNSATSDFPFQLPGSWSGDLGFTENLDFYPEGIRTEPKYGGDYSYLQQP